MKKNSRIYIVGHRGLVGSAIFRKLKAEGYRNLILRSHQELDLTRQVEVEEFFGSENPEYVFLAAAKVGGIWANNTYPAEFIHQNLTIQTNVIHASHLSSVRKLLFLGSSCIYPRDCPQPIKEEYLLSGKLEPTNEPYAIAKIVGVKMCESYNRQYGTRFVSVMPTNIYGPGDNFDLETSHALPALIRKFHEAKVKAHTGEAGQEGEKSVTVWGTGVPRREFLHVDDLADACHFVMNKEDHRGTLNIGVGKDISIGELAEVIGRIVGFEGGIVFDPSRPDGSPRKLLDISKLQSFGWHANISLQEGIEQTYQWYLNNTSMEKRQKND
ncbi:MAG: GDP-L-fucose synthase [Desulfatiglandales bacterium]|nr:GDP-L-fucose synthase [Desulfatiglandales bacterium]